MGQAQTSPTDIHVHLYGISFHGRSGNSGGGFEGDWNDGKDFEKVPKINNNPPECNAIPDYNHYTEADLKKIRRDSKRRVKKCNEYVYSKYGIYMFVAMDVLT